MSKKNRKGAKTRPATGAARGKLAKESLHQDIAELIEDGVLLEELAGTIPGFRSPFRWKVHKASALRGLVQRFVVATGDGDYHRFRIGPNPDDTTECFVKTAQPSSALAVDVLVSAHFNHREVSLTIARHFRKNELFPNEELSGRKVVKVTVG